MRLPNVLRLRVHKLLETRAPLWNTTTHYVYCNKLTPNNVDDVNTREAGGGGRIFPHHENAHGSTSPLKIIAMAPRRFCRPPFNS